MDQIKIGKFIAACRKEKGLTQAQLADKLHITDRAVSKWENARSLPDASNMADLCSILGITVNELLNGERVAIEQYQTAAEENLIALTRTAEDHRNIRRIAAVSFTAVSALAAGVCLICDLATGALSWSPFPLASLALAWTVVFPILRFGRRGVSVSLLALTVLIAPFLFLLSRLTGVSAVFAIGIVTAAPALAFLWLTFAVFRLAARGRLRAASARGISFLLAALLECAINLILARILAIPMFDIWDALVILAFLLAAAASFYSARRESRADKA